MCTQMSSMMKEMKALFRLFYVEDILRYDRLDNEYDDLMAKVSTVIKRNLLKYDQNENNTQQYVNYLNSVIWTQSKLNIFNGFRTFPAPARYSVFRSFSVGFTVEFFRRFF